MGWSRVVNNLKRAAKSEADGESLSEMISELVGAGGSTRRIESILNRYEKIAYGKGDYAVKAFLRSISGIPFVGLLYDFAKAASLLRGDVPFQTLLRQMGPLGRVISGVASTQNSARIQKRLENLQNFVRAFGGDARKFSSMSTGSIGAALDKADDFLNAPSAVVPPTQEREDGARRASDFNIPNPSAPQAPPMPSPEAKPVPRARVENPIPSPSGSSMPGDMPKPAKGPRIETPPPKPKPTPRRQESSPKKTEAPQPKRPHRQESRKPIITPQFEEAFKEAERKKETITRPSFVVVNNPIVLGDSYFGNLDSYEISNRNASLTGVERWIALGEDKKVSSSNVYSISYDEASKTLYVRYRSGFDVDAPGPTYRYDDVPAILARSFFDAASYGGWVWDNLRVRGTVSGHQFDYSLYSPDRYSDGQRYIPRKAVWKDGAEWLVRRSFTAGGKTTVSSKPTVRLRKMETNPNRAHPQRPKNGQKNR